MIKEMLLLSTSISGKGNSRPPEKNSQEAEEEIARMVKDYRRQAHRKKALSAKGNR